MIKSISNVQIENAIENIEDDDLNDNFVSVFPSNRMSKFINHSAVISSEKGKYLFVIASADSSEKAGHIGGAYLISNRKLTFFL